MTRAAGASNRGFLSFTRQDQSMTRLLSGETDSAFLPPFPQLLMSCSIDVGARWTPSRKDRDMRTPAIITKIRRVDSGAWDMGMADFSSSDLERALTWALSNDPNITVLIEDELDFRGGAL
jgi:hypothetical protein